MENTQSVFECMIRVFHSLELDSHISKRLPTIFESFYMSEVFSPSILFWHISVFIGVKGRNSPQHF